MNIKYVAETLIDFALTPLQRLLAPRRPANVIMIHLGRCGSTVVAKLLAQHAQVYWAGELYEHIFQKWRRLNDGGTVAGEMPENAFKILRNSMRRALHRTYGFEMKPYHFRLVGYEINDFVKHLDELGFTHYVILDRRNRLKKIISSVVAQQSGNSYHIKNNQKANARKIYLDVNSIKIDREAKPLLNYLQDYDDQFDAVNTALSNRRTLQLTYEEDIEKDPKVAYRKICDFVGVEAKDPLIELAKTNPFSVRQLLQNFDEVGDVLKDTGYEWMLDQ